jgi:hypothetical protein
VQDWTHISNAESKRCLDNNLEEVICTSQKTQEFALDKNELALNLTHLAKVKKNCLMPIWLREIGGDLGLNKLGLVYIGLSFWTK